jgi:hypothetical protein
VTPNNCSVYGNQVFERNYANLPALSDLELCIHGISDYNFCKKVPIYLC